VLTSGSVFRILFGEPKLFSQTLRLTDSHQTEEFLNGARRWPAVGSVENAGVNARRMGTPTLLLCCDAKCTLDEAHPRHRCVIRVMAASAVHGLHSGLRHCHDDGVGEALAQALDLGMDFSRG